LRPAPRSEVAQFTDEDAGVNSLFEPTLIAIRTNIGGVEKSPDESLDAAVCAASTKKVKPLRREFLRAISRFERG
jgi:hypothetical protein